ncbi:hypothetical protein GCM10022245_25760 [Streptomyces mayteni]
MCESVTGTANGSGNGGGTGSNALALADLGIRRSYGAAAPPAASGFSPASPHSDDAASRVCSPLW